MILKLISVKETLSTFLAFIRFFPCVNPEVPFHISQMVKTFVTLFALEGLFSFINSFMRSKVSTLVKVLWCV